MICSDGGDWGGENNLREPHRDWVSGKERPLLETTWGDVAHHAVGRAIILKRGLEKIRVGGLLVDTPSPAARAEVFSDREKSGKKNRSGQRAFLIVQSVALASSLGRKA